LLASTATALVFFVAEKVLFFHSPPLGYAMMLAGPLTLSGLLLKNWHTKRRGLIAAYLVITVLGARLFAFKWGAEMNRANWEGSPFQAAGLVI
jgi:hypothetical protein